MTLNFLCTKVSGPILVTYLKLEPAFEKCVARYGSKNGHKKKAFVLEKLTYMLKVC